MESPENENTVFRPSHKTLKIDETYFHIPTAMTMTEQFFHLKPEKPVQTIGATSLISVEGRADAVVLRAILEVLRG